MARATGVSFPQNKDYLYEYACNRGKKFSNYVIDLIEADYNNNAEMPTRIDTAVIVASLTNMQGEIARIKKLLK